MKKSIKKTVSPKKILSLTASVQKLEESIKDIKTVRSDMRLTIKDLLKSILDNSSVCAKIEKLTEAKKLAEFVGDQVILTLFQLNSSSEISLSDTEKALKIKSVAIEAIRHYFKINCVTPLPDINESMARRLIDMSGFDIVDVPQ